MFILANPTPILQQINAFDATKGTTINYSVVGGTDIIRYSRIKIYNATTNKLKLDYLPHYTGAKPETIEVILLTFRDKKIPKNFSQNFTTFSQTL